MSEEMRKDIDKVRNFITESSKSILEPESYAKKTGKIKRSGELYWTSKEMQYFSETYCRIPFSIVDKSLLKSKMIDCYNMFLEYDAKGYAIWRYTEKPRVVELYH